MAIFGLASFFAQQVRSAETEGERVHEVMVGLVVDLKDPDQQGRVKVRFPTLGPDATWWCPVVSIGAGADRGWFTLPEIDDEVVVGFEHGDLARPVVLGAIWNGKDRAPDANPDGDNPRRMIRSKTGHTVTFDDQDGALRLADGAGIATVTIAASGGITLEAHQGDVAIQCRDELQLLAGEIAITARGSCDLIGARAGVDATGTGGVKINGKMVALKGATIDVNPGGVASAAIATGTVTEVPGSDPGTNRPAQAGDGGPAGASGSGGARGRGASAASPAGGGPSAAPGPEAAAAAAGEPVEPVPALLSATWSVSKARPGDPVKLLAMCLDLAGQAATFSIRAADGAPVGTASGTCGEAMVEASWTTPRDGRGSPFTFTVEAGGQTSDAGLLALVAPFTATLILDDVPAFGVEVELETVETGDRVRAIADADGQVAIPEAALGTWRLHLVTAEDA